MKTHRCTECDEQTECFDYEGNRAKATIIVLAGGTVCSVFLLLIVFNFAATILDKSFPIDREILVYTVAIICSVLGYSAGGIQNLLTKRGGAE